MLKIAQCDETFVKAIEAQLGLPPLIAHILVARGVHLPEAIEAFLSPKIESLSDPLLLPDIEKGISKIVEMIQGKKRIGLFGDYDADGITSVALMKNFLKQVGIVPDVYLPTRRDGYGLNQDVVKMFSEKGVDLFALKVQGESMIDAMVNDGDIVIMKRTEQASNGDMVAIWLPARDETTLKYFYKEKDNYRLQPANPTMKPIMISKNEPLEIKGKVVMVIRNVGTTAA